MVTGTGARHGAQRASRTIFLRCLGGVSEMSRESSVSRSACSLSIAPSCAYAEALVATAASAASYTADCAAEAALTTVG